MTVSNEMKIKIMELCTSGTENKNVGEKGRLVATATLTLSNNHTVINGEDYRFGEFHKYESDLPKYIGKNVIVKIRCIKNKEGKIYLLKSPNAKINQKEMIIEGQIIEIVSRIAKPPNDEEITVHDAIVDAGVIITVPNIQIECTIADWIHIDGWLEFSDVKYK